IYKFLNIKGPCIPFSEIILIIWIRKNFYNNLTSGIFLFNFLPEFHVCPVGNRPAHINEVRLFHAFQSVLIISLYGGSRKQPKDSLKQISLYCFHFHFFHIIKSSEFLQLHIDFLAHANRRSALKVNVISLFHPLSFLIQFHPPSLILLPFYLCSR